MKLFRSWVALALVVLVGHAALLAAEPLKVDISPQLDRKDHLSRDLENWMIAADEPATLEQGGVKFELASADGKSPLKADWWKAGLVHDATMASDGAFIESGGIKLTIRGLAPGPHSLVKYYNSIWDAELGPFEILVDGKPALSDVRPTKRVTAETEAASAYLEFEAAAGQDVVVEIRPVAASTDRRTILNGIELDTANPREKATQPQPFAGDEHVAERPVLSWKPSKVSAAAHDVYFGTDAAAVAAATHDSPEFKGQQGEAEFKTDADDPSQIYYWRIDEVLATKEPRTAKGDVWSFRVRQLAFPEAEGYGRFARGGRGGRVIEVTNLNDSGPGSLRAAVEAEGPRTVVFNVGGLITLESKLIVKNPYLTIAGQTAPGKGICIRKYNLGVGGSHDIIIRYVRVRPGNIAGVTLDGMGLAGTDHAIIDHCSISWTQDESFSSRGAKNITFQRNLISEALNIAGHKKYEKGKQHGYAASIGGDIGSFHHNLLAHCAGRNWSLAGGLDKATRHTGRLDIRNNVVYNWGHRTTDGGVMELNYVNNYYKPGPASEVFHVLMPERHLVEAFGPQDYYVEGNVMEGHYGPDEPLKGVRGQRHEPIEDFIVDKPFFESFVATQSAAEAYEDVLADVGCNLPALDEHDQRVIEETRSGAAAFKGSVSGLPGLPDTQDDVGGWDDYPEVHRDANWDTDHDGLPNDWEAAHGLNPNSPADDFRDANADPDGDGCTNLEEYLESIVSRSRGKKERN